MERPLSYKKMKGFATTHGQEFQVNLVALLLLRGQSSGLKFQLAANVEGAGALDDIVFRYQPKEEPGKWTTIYMHLKHKEKSYVTPSTLTHRKGDFALSKFINSYLSIKQVMSVAEKETLFDGSFDKCWFVMFTNAKAKLSLGEGRCENLTRAEEFLRTDSGSVFSFEEDKNVLKCLRKCGDEGKTFLSRLRVFCDQPKVDDLKADIKKELLKVADKITKGIDLHRLYDVFLDNVKVWWESSQYILHNGHDLLLRALDKVRSEALCQTSLAYEYEFKGDIAAGGFGEVQRVKSILDGREYAAKKIRLLTKNIKENQAQLTEVQILASLEHDCIARYMSVRIEPSDENFSSQLSLENSIEFGENPSTDKLCKINSESCVKFREKWPSSSSHVDVGSTVVSYLGSSEAFESSDSEDDVFEGPTMYILQSLYEGNLRQWLDRRYELDEQVDVARSLAAAKAIFRGLEYLDSQGIVHHDIKPANVFVDSTLQVVRIGDFGLACVLRGSQTELHARKGSIPYAAPDEECTTKSDIFSAGIVFFELLTLCGTNMELIRTIERMQTIDDHLQAAALSPEQLQLMKRMVCPSQEQRPSAGEMVVALDGLLVAARPSSDEDKDETVCLLKRVISEKNKQIKKITKKKNEKIRKMITRKNQGTPSVIAKKDPKTQKIIEKKNEEIKKIVGKKNLQIKQIVMKNSQEMEAMITKNNQHIKNLMTKKNKQTQKIILQNHELKKTMKEKDRQIRELWKIILQNQSATDLWDNIF